MPKKFKNHVKIHLKITSPKRAAPVRRRAVLLVEVAAVPKLVPLLEGVGCGGTIAGGSGWSHFVDVFSLLRYFYF
jgi:hypothetical protein